MTKVSTFTKTKFLKVKVISMWVLLRPFPTAQINQIAGDKSGKGKGGGKGIHFSVKVIVKGQGH